MFSDIDTILLERGWVVVDLPDPSPVNLVAKRFSLTCRLGFPTLHKSSNITLFAMTRSMTPSCTKSRRILVSAVWHQYRHSQYRSVSASDRNCISTCSTTSSASCEAASA